MAEYLTIGKDISNSIEKKKSKFITNIFKVTSEQQVEDRLTAVKKEHNKANHNCSAYILGKDSLIRHSSDDGEPTGTAGVPILNVLIEKNITNVLAVVTRYFGGTKLGTGGLIRAYSSSISSAIKDSDIVQAVNLQELIITMPYNLLDTFKYTSNYEISSIDYTDTVKITIYIPINEKENYIKNLKYKFNNALNIVEGNIKLREIPIKND
ncbi:YigZ family protein [Companilactobacillus sp. DQM5]|uniref:YigZ family protein n=1 Tax=Companilactobacillus sp. DQM5 TaxID=3463359 RepID=UPI004059092B